MKNYLFLFLVCSICLSTIAQQVFIIDASAGEGGIIARSGKVPVKAGATQEFIIRPDPGEAINGLIVDGQPAAFTTEFNYSGAFSTYRFTDVHANHKIRASFTPAAQYTIHATAEAGGSIDPAGDVKVNKGSSWLFTVRASEGYGIEHVLVDHVVQGPVGPTDIFQYSFQDVSSDHIIRAVFVSKDEARYTLRATAGKGGSITPSMAKVKYDGSASFLLRPDPGFVITAVRDNTTSYGHLYAYPEFNYTVSNVKEDHNIEALFDSAVHTLTAIQGSGGSIDPGSVKVKLGEISPVFSIHAEEGYVISSLLVDGSPVPLEEKDSTNASYSFFYVYEPHSIAVSFIPSNTRYAITASANAGGTITPVGTTHPRVGSSQAYAIKAMNGFAIRTLKVDGALASTYFDPGLTDYTYTFFNIHASHSIEAGFVSLDKTFTITGIAKPHGSIQPDGETKIRYNGSLTYDINADPGYRVQDVLVDGFSRFSLIPEPLKQFHYTFTNVVANHQIQAWFSPEAAHYFHIYTEWTGAIGTIYGPQLVDSGAWQLYRIVARPDFKVALIRLSVDGYPVDPASSYTFLNIQSDHVLKADFSLRPDCNYFSSYGLPGPALPSFKKDFDHIYVISGNGINDIGRAAIEWNAATRQLQQFFIAPLNGNDPEDLAGSTQDFATNDPSMTIARSHTSPINIFYLDNIDNVYDAGFRGDDFALVARSGLYVLLFSNSDIPEQCPSNAMRLDRVDGTRKMKAEKLPDRQAGLLAYPDPFGDQLTIVYRLDRSANVGLYLSDAFGNRVALLLPQQVQGPGKHILSFNSSGLPSGVYFYTLQAGGIQQTGKIDHIKK
jgi:hypothetical protein